jgi:Fe2+ or Zn2+ uptake regulation protein
VKFETAVGKIRRGGYKATPQRLAILGAIAAEQHQRMEEIRDRCPGVGLVTVYRTLGLFRSWVWCGGWISGTVLATRLQRIITTT